MQTMSRGDRKYPPRGGDGTRMMMHASLRAVLVAGGICTAILILIEVGRRLGLRRTKRDAEGARAGLGAIEGAIFGLMGLLIAFTFSGAASRFDARRDLVVREANHIGTAWLRLDLLPAETQPLLRELFRQYLDKRIAVYEALPDVAAARAELDRANTLQGEIWAKAVAAGRTEAGQRVQNLIVPALNDMFDITTIRTMAARTHPPIMIYLLLTVLTLISALLAGYGMAGAKSPSWVHIIGFAVLMGLTVYIILDLEFPRLGLIRVDAADQMLVELRQSMN